MTNTTAVNKKAVFFNRIKTYFSDPTKIILLLFGITCTIAAVAPIIAIVEDTFKIHLGTIDQYLSGKASGWSLVNYIDLFTSKLALSNLWVPTGNTIGLAVLTCVISILYGGIFAYLVTRTNMRCRKYLSSIFIFPYIMTRWKL
jgi:ABC-type Fe3+ transport system, permease component